MHKKIPSRLKISAKLLNYNNEGGIFSKNNLWGPKSNISWIKLFPKECM